MTEIPSYSDAVRVRKSIDQRPRRDAYIQAFITGYLANSKYAEKVVIKLAIQYADIAMKMADETERDSDY